MHRVTPKVFLVGETKVLTDGMGQYLDHVGAPEWKRHLYSSGNTPLQQSDPELMIEVMGRLCYRSWAPGLNPNVTKIREGNDLYIGNIVKSKHGSVLEHSIANFIIADCSRVFTHELVRHRAGTAFSQESLRYVRLEDLGLWLPPEVESDDHLKALFEKTFRDMEQLQIAMAEHLKLDKMNFEDKKKWTSTMRRLAPHGIATAIGFSANMRALRHILEMRTAGSAEVEIRIIVDQIGAIAKARWPNVFADFKKNGPGEWVPEHSKV